MIYQQQTAAADAPAMKVETMAAAHGLSSSCFCAAAAEMAVAGEAGSYCFFASAAAMVAEDVDLAASAKSLQLFVHSKEVSGLYPAPLYIMK